MARRKKKNSLFRVRYFILVLLAVRGFVMMLRGDGVVIPAGEAVTTVTTDTEPENTKNPKPESAYTVLVNTRHPLTEDYRVTTRTIEGTDKEFDIRARGALESMLNARANDGYPILVVSAYRTIEYQQGLFDKKVAEYKNRGYSEEDAYNEAAKWVAIPGTSEHNTGLATDIVSRDYYNYYDDLEQDFENTETFTWLINHCAEYGFILRFPKDKEDITGIVYEPWHYRYVGVEVAEYIMENNLCLEEYWEE